MPLRDIVRTFGTQIGLVVGVGLGGLGGVWWLTERLIDQTAMVLVLDDLRGVDVAAGKYLLNPWLLWVALLVVLLCIVVTLSSFLVAREKTRQAVNTREIRRDYNEMLDKARAISKVMYGQMQHRIDILEADIENILRLDGRDTVRRRYKIRCVGAPVHRLEVIINADAQLSSVPGHRAVTFKARDVNGPDLDWIPTTDSPLNKTFVVFFDEMAVGTEKDVEVEFTWHGYAHLLLQKGSTEFSWSHRAATQGNKAKMKHVWRFERGFPPVSIHEIGSQQDSHPVVASKQDGCQVFSFARDDAPADHSETVFRVSLDTSP